MEIDFDPEQVFLVAKRIEENGAKFYRRAAEQVEDGDVKSLLLALADWEDRHLAFFESLRTDLSDLQLVDYRRHIERLFEPDEESARNIRELADSSVFAQDIKAHEHLTGKETVSDILRMAIQLEKEAVVFYVALREAMKASGESESLSRIIKEEMRHIAALNKALDSPGEGIKMLG